MKNDYIVLTGLKVPCVIGIFDWERKQKQDVLLDLKFKTDARKAAFHDRIEDALDYKKIAKSTISFVEKSKFKLVETLAEKLADLLLKQFNIQEIHLRVSKPGAVRGSQNIGVEITRKKIGFREELVYFSLGSNIEPAVHLRNALKAINEKFGLTAISHIYETSPVGNRKKQNNYWNMVVAVDTYNSPKEIRAWIVGLEKKWGRTRTKDRYASRTLDVDLISWKNLIIKGNGFSLPHPDISKKAFILYPLLEIAPQLEIAGLNKSMVELAYQFLDPSQKIHQIKNLPPSTLNI